MNDTSGKTSSSLAIAEKRPQRPGGCVGIFFQLFDWNRRLAKKKLFSKKLLPPARAKRASKKFGGDEKMPMAKLLLIADENRGGFPNAKKHEIDGDAKRNHEMKTPGLVARLMGLESMPAVRRDKPKKTVFSEIYHDQEKKPVDNHSDRTSELHGFDKEDLYSEKGHMKMESRPQKLQKTGIFERRLGTRFGAEALQFKSAVSRSRKHHPKLASPVKSPRVLSGRNVARLMEAATKILEPGLQATNRAKYVLTYSSYLNPAPKDEAMTDARILPPDLAEQSNYYASAAKSLKGQSSCKSCGNLLDVVDSRPNVQRQMVIASSVSDFVHASCQGSERSKPKPFISSLEQGTDLVVLKNQDRLVSIATQTQAKPNLQTRSDHIMEKKLPIREDQDQLHMSSQRYKSQKDVPSSTALKHRTKRQNEMPAKDRVPPRPKSSNLQSKRVLSSIDAVNGAKDFVAMNRNSGSCARPRMPSKAQDNCKIFVERSVCDKQDDSSSRLRVSVRKRRSMNGSGQVESTSFVSSTFEKQRIVRGNVNNGKGMGLNAPPRNRNSVKSGLPSQAEGSTVAGDRNANIVSFMFSSPIRHSEPFSSSEMEEKRRDQGELMGSSTSQQKKLLLNGRDGNTSSPNSAPLSGDALGALLEQKLKELTCQDEDELATVGTPRGRSTALILQELISALTAARPIPQEDGDNCLVGFCQKDQLYRGSWDPSNHMSRHCDMVNTKRNFQAETKSTGASMVLPLAGDGDHPSPGSVLEASFSNDSCYSGSVDGSSGHKLHPDSMDCSYDQLQSSSSNVDLSDSATSLNTGRARREMVTLFLNNISRILYSIDLVDIGITGSKLNHARGVVLNAELLFGNAAIQYADSMEDFLIVPLLLDKLESLGDALWRSPNCILDFMEAKEDHQLRRFLFDCVIECVDSKYGRYSKFGFEAWTKLPLHMNTELLIQEVYEEIRRWTNLAGKTPDEIIESEMSHSLGKWMDFEIEAYESGAEIERDILQVLVDELVTDLQ